MALASRTERPGSPAALPLARAARECWLRSYALDKQFVRDFCEQTGWDKTLPGPPLPAEVVAGTRSRYVEAFERLTGMPFDDYLANPEVFSKGD